MGKDYDRFGKCSSCVHNPPHATKCHNAAGTCRYFYYDLGDNHQELYEYRQNEHQNMEKSSSDF